MASSGPLGGCHLASCRVRVQSVAFISSIAFGDPFPDLNTGMEWNECLKFLPLLLFKKFIYLFLFERQLYKKRERKVLLSKWL